MLFTECIHMQRRASTKIFAYDIRSIYYLHFMTYVNRMHNIHIDAKTENCVTKQKCTS